MKFTPYQIRQIIIIIIIIIHIGGGRWLTRRKMKWREYGLVRKEENLRDKINV
jgi:hypothetical protein